MNYEKTQGLAMNFVFVRLNLAGAEMEILDEAAKWKNSESQLSFNY